MKHGRRRVAVVLRAAAAAVAGDSPAEPIPSGGLSRAARDQPAVLVRLRGGGHVQVKQRSAWRDATLDSLGAFLRMQKDAFEFRARRQGGSGVDELANGGTASKLFVSTEAAPETPWQHVQWLMTIAAEQRYYKLEVSDGKRRMLVFLPTDRGIFPKPREGPREVKLAVDVAARGWEEAAWAGETVRRPAGVVYRFGDEESADLAALGAYLREGRAAAAKDEEDVVVRGEIKADYRMPWARVLDVMETFLEQGQESVSFHGTPVPPSPLREAERLPYPIRSYPADG